MVQFDILDNLPVSLRINVTQVCEAYFSLAIPAEHRVDSLAQLSTAAFVYAARIDPYPLKVKGRFPSQLAGFHYLAVARAFMFPIFNEVFMRDFFILDPTVAKYCVGWELRIEELSESQVLCV